MPGHGPAISEEGDAASAFGVGGAGCEGAQVGGLDDELVESVNSIAEESWIRRRWEPEQLGREAEVAWGKLEWRWAFRRGLGGEMRMVPPLVAPERR